MTDKQRAVQSVGSNGHEVPRDAGMGRRMAVARGMDTFHSCESPPLGEPSRRNRILDHGANAAEGGQR